MRETSFDFQSLLQRNVPKAYRALCETILDSGLSPRACAEQLSTELNDQLSYYRYFTLAKEFGAAGGPAFVLSHSIAAALTATCAPAIPFTRLPYPAFFIEVPSEYLPIPDHPNRGRDFPKRWISVVSTPVMRAVSLHTQGFMSVAYVQAQNDLSPIGEEIMREACLGSISGLDPSRVRQASFEMQLAVRLASNVVAYVTAYRESVTELRRSFPADVQVLDVSAPREVIVDCQFRMHVKDLVAARTIPRARGVLRHLVRGHWRTLPGKEDLLWIAPYRRGDLNIGRIVERIDRL